MTLPGWITHASVTSSSITTGSLYYLQSTNGTTTAISGNAWFDVDGDGTWHESGQHSLTELLRGRKYTLPDKSEIEIDAAGNWKLVKDGGIQYRAANIRNFNRFLNASDLLEAFIADCGRLGVTQGEFLRIPIEAFINWLILRAAEADGDELPIMRYNFRCGQCKRFLPKRLVALGVNFCSPPHLERFLHSAHLPIKGNTQ